MDEMYEAWLKDMKRLSEEAGMPIEFFIRSLDNIPLIREAQEWASLNSLIAEYKRRQQ